MRPLNVIGLNSGTSMDGIDAALFSIKPVGSAGSHHKNSTPPKLEIELISSLLLDFEPAFRRRLKAGIGATNLSWSHVCMLNTALGELFAEAALRLIRNSKHLVSHIDLIGSHGQTLWHAPDPKAFWGVKTSGTLQLGEPAVIAERTGLPVVADFRPADVAAGGEGAPLVSFADEVLFGQTGVPTGVLNLGGIANITVLNVSALMAFDTGPANVLVDRAVQVLFGRQFDDGGELAHAGKVDKEWLEQMLAHPYFKRTPPKTTGRELFGDHFADLAMDKAKERGLSNNDCVATLTALSAHSISRAYRDFVEERVKIEKLVVGGGGADNLYLLDSITQSWPHEIKIQRHEDFGISTKFKEALLFALLAYTTYFGIPNNVPACTGASRRVCLGKLISQPSMSRR